MFDDPASPTHGPRTRTLYRWFPPITHTLYTYTYVVQMGPAHNQHTGCQRTRPANHPQNVHVHVPSTEVSHQSPTYSPRTRIVSRWVPPITHTHCPRIYALYWWIDPITHTLSIYSDIILSVPTDQTHTVQLHVRLTDGSCQSHRHSHAHGPTHNPHTVHVHSINGSHQSLAYCPRTLYSAYIEPAYHTHTVHAPVRYIDVPCASSSHCACRRTIEGLKQSPHAVQVHVACMDGPATHLLTVHVICLNQLVNKHTRLFKTLNNLHQSFVRLYVENRCISISKNLIKTKSAGI